jgi:uncharacterized protein YutE (UPF0331/DUF86 family)
MIDQDIVARRILVLNETLLNLEGLRPHLTAQQLVAEPLVQAALERWIQVAVECCIDLAYHVVSARGWTPPDSARGAFESLASHGVIPSELAQRLARAAGMRNILVHDYVRVDRGVLVGALGSALDDLRSFGALVGMLIPAEP